VFYKAAAGAEPERFATKSLFRRDNTAASGNDLQEYVKPGAFGAVTISAIPLTSPVTGETPEKTVGTAQFKGTVAWDGALADGKFVEGTSYTATITLTATGGYTLDGLGTNFFTVKNATSVSYNSTDKKVTAVFPAAQDGFIKMYGLKFQNNLTNDLEPLSPLTFVGTQAYEDGAKPGEKAIKLSGDNYINLGNTAAGFDYAQSFSVALRCSAQKAATRLFSATKTGMRAAITASR
jgi:hypothetical protein